MELTGRIRLGDQGHSMKALPWGNDMGRQNAEGYERDERKRNRKVRFDGTVTLGNVLTLLGMLGTMLALWRNMEQRMLIVEERQAVQTRSVDKLVQSVERLTLIQAAAGRLPKEQN